MLFFSGKFPEYPLVVSLLSPPVWGFTWPICESRSSRSLLLPLLSPESPPHSRPIAGLFWESILQKSLTHNPCLRLCFCFCETKLSLH